MNSPASPKTSLVKIDLEPNLIAYHCPDSGGNYLPAESYWRWLGKHPERLPQLPPSGDELPLEEEITTTRLCPESGIPMMRYKVGHGFSFSIDRSPNGGIWFDQGEWEALRAHNFHDELHLIFTLPWQNKVRRAISEERLNEILKKRIGSEAFEKTNNFREWLQKQPEQNAIIAYLQNH